MSILFHGLGVVPVMPILPSYPPHPTFVSAANAAMTPMSAPSTPPTTAQQLQSIFGQSITVPQRTPEVLPRYSTPQEAGQALMSNLRGQWSAMYGGSGTITEKEEAQQRMMRTEKDILGQLRQMGYPTRVRVQ